MAQRFFAKLSRPICLPNVSEDDLRALVDAIEVGIHDDENLSSVVSSGGVDVSFRFGSDGNFNGAFAQLGGNTVELIPGTYSKAMQLFKGSPSGSNPGVGWTVETELTKKYLSQVDDENQWELFFASRAPVLSTI